MAHVADFSSASTAVIVRMGFVMEFRSADFLYATVDIAIWSDIELGLAITAGSLATLRPLYRIVSARLGLTQSATQQKPSEKMSREWYRPTADSKRKPSGPFSLVSLKRPDRMRSADDSSEEYSMGNLQPIQLRDDLIEESPQEKGFNSWRIQVGGTDSEEELHQKPQHGGITRQTDVYLESHGRR